MRRRAAPATPPVEKLAFLEGLRGLAALYVVLSHLCSMADPSRLAGKASQAPEWLQRAMSPFAYGHLAVAAFIVISGFCLQLSLYSNGTGKIVSLKGFFKRRAKRILPAYYACLAFSLAVCFLVTVHQPGMPFQMYLPVTWPNTLAHVFLVHNLSPAWMYKINGVLWSIAVEVQLYLLFPLIVASFARIGRWGVALGATLVSAAAWTWVPGAPKLYPWYLALFVFGMMAAHAAYRPNLRWGARPWLAVALGWPLLGLSVAACVRGATLAECDGWLGAGVACLIYAWTVRPSFRLGQALSGRAWVALGAFSYSLYLMHHPIQQVVFVMRPGWVVGEGLALAYLVVVGLPVILGLSWVFSHAFERPFLTRRRPSAAPAGPVEFTPVSLPLRCYHSAAKAA